MQSGTCCTRAFWMQAPPKNTKTEFFCRSHLQSELSFPGLTQEPVNKNVNKQLCVQFITAKLIMVTHTGQEPATCDQRRVRQKTEHVGSSDPLSKAV